MFCTNCGKEIKIKTKFCPECGAALEERNQKTVEFLVDKKKKNRWATLETERLLKKRMLITLALLAVLSIGGIAYSCIHGIDLVVVLLFALLTGILLGWSARLAAFNNKYIEAEDSEQLAITGTRLNYSFIRKQTVVNQDKVELKPVKVEISLDLSKSTIYSNSQQTTITGGFTSCNQISDSGTPVENPFVMGKPDNIALVLREYYDKPILATLQHGANTVAQKMKKPLTTYFVATATVIMVITEIALIVTWVINK